jgi:hypothetical protein
MIGAANSTTSRWSVVLNPSALIISRFTRYSAKTNAAMINPIRITAQRHCFNTVFHNARHQRQPQRRNFQINNVAMGNRNKR